MGFYYSENEIVKVSMNKYINNAFREFPEHLGSSLSLLAADHLFKVRTDIKSNYLPEEQS